MSEYNPFSAPPAFDDPTSEIVAQRVYGGIGRLAYFGLSILIGVVSNVVMSLIVSQTTPGQSQAPVIAVAIVGLLNLTASVTVIVLRLKNLGMNGFWVLGLIVPILNLVLPFVSSPRQRVTQITRHSIPPENGSSVSLSGYLCWPW